MRTSAAHLILGTLLAGCLAGCIDRQPEAAKPSGAATSASAIVNLTDATFGANTSTGVVLVDFTAAWCPACKIQRPVIEAVARQVAGRVLVSTLDVDAAPETAQRFGIDGIPALIIFRNGKPVYRSEGLTSADELTRALDSAPNSKPL